MFMFVVTTEGPIYCLEKNQADECRKAIKNIYQISSETQVELIMSQIAAESTNNQS